MEVTRFLVLLVLVEAGTCLNCNYCLEVSSIGSDDTNERIADFEQVSCKKPQSVSCGADKQYECVTATLNVTITFTGADSTLMLIPINVLTQTCAATEEDFCKNKKDELVATVTNSENFPESQSISSTANCDKTYTCTTDNCGKLEAAKSGDIPQISLSIITATFCFITSAMSF
ncbi:hypothetical protein ACHWQZ_G015332 [Mnemiopsis leidyi]